MKFSYLIDRVVNIDFQNLNQTLDTVPNVLAKASSAWSVTWLGAV